MLAHAIERWRAQLVFDGGIAGRAGELQRGFDRAFGDLILRHKDIDHARGFGEFRRQCFAVQCEAAAHTWVKFGDDKIERARRIGNAGCYLRQTETCRLVGADAIVAGEREAEAAAERGAAIAATVGSGEP